MKKIYALTTTLLFLVTINFGFSQECMLETRVDDPESNKTAAKCLKFFCQDNNIVVGSATIVFGKSKTIKGVYLRHSFPKEWYVGKKEDGSIYRSCVVLVAVKTETGCQTVALSLNQISLGLNTWGTMKAHNSNKNLSFKEYYKENLDCDCIMKQKDWLAE